jgi:CRISPR-associated protein Cas2
MATVRRDLYLVCYDICGKDADKRLRKVYRCLRGFGEHVQFSVFRCILTERQLAELEGALVGMIDPRQDQVMLVPLGSADVPGAWAGWTLGIPIGDPERVVRIV